MTPTLTPGQRYTLTWKVPCMTAGAAEPQVERVTVASSDGRFVDGHTDSGARVDCLPLSCVTSAVPS